MADYESRGQGSRVRGQGTRGKGQALIINGPAPKKPQASSQKYWQITNKGADTAEVLIYGDIGEGFWSEGVGAKQFAKDLKALGDGIKNLDVRINSAGGSVFEGLAIHNTLKAHKAQKTGYVDALAASIASVILMACDLIVMPENAMLMIHDPSALAMGTADDMRKMADALDKIKLSLVTSYRRSGKTDEEIAQLMTDETWMTADDAREMGFCDEITGAMKMAAAFDLSSFKNVPANLIITNILNKDPETAPMMDPGTCEKKNKDTGCKDCSVNSDCKKEAQAKAASPKNKEVVKMHKCTVCGHEHADGTTCPVCAAKTAAVNAEQVRVAEIMALGQKHGFLDKALDMVKQNKTIEDMKTFVIENMGTAKPLNVSASPTSGDKPFKSFGEQLLAIASAAKAGIKPDARLLQIQNAASGSSEGVPADGGFLVQEDFTMALLDRVNETGLLTGKCRRIPLSGNANGLKAPMVDETTRATGSRWGGIQVYWANEADSVTAKKPKFWMMNLSLEKLMGICYATEELMQDASALEAIISQGFSEEFGFMLDDGIVNGTGVGQLLGILNAASLVSVSKETGQSAATIQSENIEKMYSRMPAKLLGGAEWYINQECWPQIFGLHKVVGTGGVPIFVPPGGMSSAPFGSLLGRPIVPIEQCAALGTVGDIIFANLNQYVIIEKGGMNSQASIHVRFLYDENTFKFTLRINGQPMWKSAVSPYKGSATVSPFIGLATRS